VQSVQLSSNDFYKRLLAGDSGELTVSKRLLAGAAAGMTATAVGHPLDTLRLRLALPNSGYTGMTDALFKVVRGEGALALAKGLPAALAGIAPYAAVNFAAYDMTKKLVYDKLQVRTAPTDPPLKATQYTPTACDVPVATPRAGGLHRDSACPRQQPPVGQQQKVTFCKLSFRDPLRLVRGPPQVENNWVTNAGVGAATGLFSASVCYPLDTVRRRMQMKGGTYKHTLDCFYQIATKEGYQTFFKGWAANALKVVPQNSIRFVSYELLKTLLGVQKAKTDT
jgi:solute carrier family 25 phosphate transporter 23/24/25/41